MALRPYEEFAANPLIFPIGGKEYVCPPMSIASGLALADIQKNPDDELAQAEPIVLWKLVLGPLWDEFVADNVSSEAATRAGLTALADYQFGRAIAEATWEAGVDPKALADLVIQRATGNRATRRSHSTGGANKTPSRARSKATTSPQS